MMRRELEADLKMLGLRYRFERVIPLFGMAGVVAGAGIMNGTFPLEVVYCAPLSILLFLLPVSAHRVARAVNRRHGDDPDMLCAVERQDPERPAIQALYGRCCLATRSYLAQWRVGRRWFWVGCSTIWCLPAFVHTQETWYLAPPETMGNDKMEVASESTVPNSVARQPDAKPASNEPSLPPEPIQPAVVKKAVKGRLASLEGTKTQVTSSVASVSESGSKRATFTIPGRGIGGALAPGKLTETAKRGTIGVLKEDHLDPSEKYPVEYHEAIREWFLKRRN